MFNRQHKNNQYTTLQGNRNNDHKTIQTLGALKNSRSTKGLVLGSTEKEKSIQSKYVPYNQIRDNKNYDQIKTNNQEKNIAHILKQYDKQVNVQREQPEIKPQTLKDSQKKDSSSNNAMRFTRKRQQNNKVIKKQYGPGTDKSDLSKSKSTSNIRSSDITASQKVEELQQFYDLKFQKSQEGVLQNLQSSRLKPKIQLLPDSSKLRQESKMIEKSKKDEVIAINLTGLQRNTIGFQRNLDGKMISNPNQQYSQKRMSIADSNAFSKPTPYSNPGYMVEIQKSQEKMLQQVKRVHDSEKIQMQNRIHQLQNEKRTLKEENIRIIQAQFQVHGELKMMKAKNQQLQFDLSQAKDRATRVQMQHNNSSNKNDKMLIEVQNKISEMNNRYKQQMNDKNKLSHELNQLANDYYLLQNQNLTLRGIIEKQQEEKLKKYRDYEATLNNLKIRYQQQISALKQQIENNITGFSLKNENIIKQFEKSLEKKQQKISSLQEIVTKNENLYKQKTELQRQFNFVNSENIRLKQQFARMSQKLIKISLQNSNQIKRYENIINLKDKNIRELSAKLSQIQSNSNRLNLTNISKNSLYGSGQSQVGSFQTLVKSHMDELNSLRDQIYQKQEEIYNLKEQIQNVKSNLRKSQQQINILTQTNNINLRNLNESKNAIEIQLKNEVDFNRQRTAFLEDQIQRYEKQIRQKNQLIQNSLTNQKR